MEVVVVPLEAVHCSRHVVLIQQMGESMTIMVSSMSLGGMGDGGLLSPESSSQQLQYYFMVEQQHSSISSILTGNVPESQRPKTNCSNRISVQYATMHIKLQCISKTILGFFAPCMPLFTWFPIPSRIIPSVHYYVCRS